MGSPRKKKSANRGAGRRGETSVPQKTAGRREWTKIPDELQWSDVGGRLLANLARGIYDADAVLREYVQNACDAYNGMHSSVARSVQISVTGSDLHIQDSGSGMDENTIRAYKKIAVSPKSIDGSSAGFRGIGVWAGFQACDTLIVITSQSGSTKRHRLTVDFSKILANVDRNLNIKNLIDPHYRIESSDDESADTHYTRVTLKGINADFNELLDEERLLRVVSENLPCPLSSEFSQHERVNAKLLTWPLYKEFAIAVRVGGRDVLASRTPSDQPGIHPAQHEVLKVGNTEVARVWFCRSTKTSLSDKKGLQRGFRVRVHNFAVGESNLYSEKIKTRSRLNWYCGEIHITDPNIIPNTPRSALEEDQFAKDAVEEIKEFYKRRTLEADQQSAFNAYVDAVTQANKSLDAGDPLPEHTRDGIIARLTAVPDVIQSPKTSAVLRELLQNKEFESGRASVLKRLDALRPKKRKTKKSTASQPPPTPESSTAKDDGLVSAGPAAGDINRSASLSVEDLISRIVCIIEDHLQDQDADFVAELSDSVAAEITNWTAGDAD